MRVLVLGGSGFVGCHIVRRLLSSGHEVRVFSRGRLRAEVNVITGDRNYIEASAPALRDFRPDVVIDAIAYTQEQAEGAVAAFRGMAKRIVVLSSGDVYRANDLLFRRIEGAIEPTPLTEQSPLRERLYPYRGAGIPPVDDFSLDDYDKILVERIVLSNPGLPATVLRLPMVYGPGDYTGGKRRFEAYWKRMDDRRPVILLDQQTARWRAPWGYVEDVAEAVVLAVENSNAAGEIYNVCEQDALCVRDWVGELATVAGWRGRIVVVDQPCPPPSLPRSLNTDQNLHMDSTKIRRELGYRETVPRDEALRRTIAWERDHPPARMDPTQFDYAAEDRILATANPADR